MTSDTNYAGPVSGTSYVDSDVSRVDAEAVLRGVRYRTIPESILFGNASDKAIRLYLILDSYLGRNETAWPSRRTLADDLKCSLKTIDRTLQELATLGIVTITHRYRSDGSFTSSDYRLTSPHECREVASPMSLGQVTNDAAIRNTIEGTPNTFMINPKVDRRTNRPYADEFESVWALYPKKRGKDEAYAAFVARVRAGVDVATLKQAVINYASIRAGQNPEFTVGGKRFFNPSYWKDYVDDSFDVESSESVEAQIDRAVQFISDLFLTYGSRQTIARPVDNALVERLLKTTTMMKLGMMSMDDVKKALQTVAWDSKRGEG